MFTADLLTGFIMGIREGLEAFLVIAIMLEYMNKTSQPEKKKNVLQGLVLGLFSAIIFGVILFGISHLIGQSSSNIAKLWESGMSFIALILITSFIYYMIKHKGKITSEITSKLDSNLTKWGVITLAAVLVAREGAEIVLFIFASADKFNYGLGAIIGVLISGAIAFLIFKSLIKVNLKTIFNITLIYLIIQAGFMLGYSIHEFLSYLKATEVLSGDSWVYTKLFDLSGTFLNHKEQPIGIALYALIGWYSKPEIIQFVFQYIYTFGLLLYFFKKR